MLGTSVSSGENGTRLKSEEANDLYLRSVAAPHDYAIAERNESVNNLMDEYTTLTNLYYSLTFGSNNPCRMRVTAFGRGSRAFILSHEIPRQRT